MQKSSKGFKIAPIKQWDEDSCGPACIEMTACYFNVPLTRDQIIKVTAYKEREGLLNTQLVGSLEVLGFQVESESSVSWERLQQANTDKVVIIVSWMLNGYIGHFSIVDHLTDSHIHLADPENGKISKFEKIRFLRLWMDYDDMWYPETNTDIQLRWMCIVRM